MNTALIAIAGTAVAVLATHAVCVVYFSKNEPTRRRHK